MPLMPRRHADAGFTIIEVLVAAWLAIMVIGATAVVFAQGNASSLAVQRQSEMIAVADQQIENIRQQVKTGAGGFSALAMSAAPAAGSDTTLGASSSTYLDPTFRGLRHRRGDGVPPGAVRGDGVPPGAVHRVRCQCHQPAGDQRLEPDAERHHPRHVRLLSAPRP